MRSHRDRQTPSYKWLPPALWMGVLFGLSAVPGTAYPDARAIPFADKLVHIGLYLVLGLLLVRALAARPGAVAATLVPAAVAIGIAFGLSDELHQLFVPFRSCDVRDLAADAIGLATGAALWKRRLARRNDRARTLPAVTTEDRR